MAQDNPAVTKRDLRMEQEKRVALEQELQQERANRPLDQSQEVKRLQEKVNDLQANKPPDLREEVRRLQGSLKQCFSDRPPDLRNRVKELESEVDRLREKLADFK